MVACGVTEKHHMYVGLLLLLLLLLQMLLLLQLCSVSLLQDL